MCKIFVVCHKETKKNYKSNIRYSIHVGKSEFRCDYYDDKGYNISEKNNNYCELTALYWMWKNSDSEILGLEHYRRMFRSKKRKLLYDNLIEEKEIKKYLSTYDIILPKKHYITPFTVESDYREGEKLGNHIFNDFVILENVIKTYFPDYYNNFYEAKNLNYYYPFNMLITNKKLFAYYCEFLFSVLSKVEDKINLDYRSGNQIRVFGYLSERLINVWVIHNKLKVKELSVYFADNSSKVKKIMRRIKN